MTNQKLNRRQARWALELAEFDFKLVHKPGSSMVCADALSRRPDYNKGDEDNAEITLLKPEYIRAMAVKYTSSPLVDDIRKESTMAEIEFN
jgi:hypothetical protein